MGERIVYDVLAGNPNLPDVPDATFTPAKPSTYLGLLVDFGWLDAKDAEAASGATFEDTDIDKLSL